MKKSLKIDHITKVEGHGRLHINLKDKGVESVKLEIFEGARYFETLVKDKDYSQVPEITPRICGICSQSHLLCATQAIENAFKVRVSKQTKMLREIMMLGSLLQSHILHLYFLALPDYLGFSSAIDMSKRYKEEVKRALRLKKFANKIVTTIGGREIHSVRPIIGGFTKFPTKDELKSLEKDFIDLKDDFQKTVDLFLSLDYPDYHRETDYLSLRGRDGFDLLKGNLLSYKGIKSIPKNYKKYITEKVVDYSNTKLVTLKGDAFMVGPLARVNVNKKYLSRNAKCALNSMKAKFPSFNPYLNNAARAVEIIDFMDRCKNLLKGFDVKEEKVAKINPVKGHGTSIIEAPRGLLIHDYHFDSKGKVKKANIIAPTTQNLYNIEEDAKQIISEMLKKTTSEKKILFTIEKLVRAYDPCISCSTHFLDLVWNKK